MHPSSPRSRAPRRVLLALTAVALLLAACGGDNDETDTADTTETSDTADAAVTTETSDTGDTADTTETSDTSATSDSAATGDTTAGTDGEVGEDEEAYVDAIVADFSGDDTDTAACLAREYVSAIGLEQLQSAGVTPQQLVQASSLTEAGLEIDDATATELESAVAGCGDLLELTIGETDASDADRACAEEHLTNEITAHVFVATFRGETPNAEAQQAATDFQACVGG